MKNINLYTKTSITGLQFGSNQKVDLGKGLVFLKDSPVCQGDEYIYDWMVINTKNNTVVEQGFSGSLADLKKQAKRFKA